MSAERFTIAVAYPKGLRPWDGRFYKADSGADVVVLTLSDDQRSSREYAFRIADDGFQILGRRVMFCTGQKRPRWTTYPLTSVLSVSWVPWEVLSTAVGRWREAQTAMVARIKAHVAGGGQ